MAVLYKISLSSKDESVNVADTSVSLRGTELEILEICVGLAGSREKDLKKYNLCNDLFQQIKDLPEDASEISDLTKDDIELIKAGFVISADLQGGRPFKWIKCKKLFSQILEPVEKIKEE